MRRKHIFMLSVLVAVALGAAIVRHLPWRLDYNDQAKQAFVSREMVEQHRWWFQHSPDGANATKPPLCGWLSAATYGLTRSWKVAWHGPSFFAGLLLAYLIARMAQPLGEAATVLALAAFLLNYLTQRLLIMVRTDMLLALAVFAPVYMVWSHLRGARPWRPADRALFALLLWAGLMVKGPVSYAFVLPGILAFLWWRRDACPPDSLPRWPEFVVPLLLIGGWALAGIRTEPGFYEQVVLQEFGSRFTPAGVNLAKWSRILWYYPTHLLARCFPWGLALPVLLAVPAARRRVLGKPEGLWLLCAFVGGMAAMSLVPSKRPDRIYPLVPILSVLVALLAVSLPDAHRLVRFARRWGWAALALLLAAHVGHAAFRVIEDSRRQEGALVAFGEQARRMADAQGIRLGVLKSVAFETGMVLYADAGLVLDPADVQREWEAGRLGGLIVRAADAAEFLPRLAGADVALVSAAKDASEPPHALLLRAPFSRP